MPNYIKNRIKLSGEKEHIDKLIEIFSTFYPEEQHTSFDGENTYRNENEEFGWLNAETNTFRRRNIESVIGVPDGFKPYMKEAWTRFPDFEKITKMPESLNISSDSWVMPLDNQFASRTELKAHLNELKAHLVKHPDIKAETIDNFIKGVKNYLEYGHATWYTWSVENWGTKWNSSECEKIDTNTFDFITAWSGVPNLIEKMSKMNPNVTIEYKLHLRCPYLFTKKVS